jgi:hypothetical protein
MSRRSQMHERVKLVDPKTAEHIKRAMESDYALVSRLSLLKANHNPNWLALKMRPTCFGDRKNRSGRSLEHAEALLENALRDLGTLSRDSGR